MDEGTAMDVLARLQRAVMDGAVNRDLLIAAGDEISDLRRQARDHYDRMFYLACHPEHVEEIVGEALFGQEYERDSCGHVITRG